MKIEKDDALMHLAGSEQLFKTLFQHGTLKVEVYKPKDTDLQQPHSQDEIYIIINGSGEFVNDGQRTLFAAGDFLFVPAGAAHRFENFSSDFSTWVIFYGPEGGENPH